MASNTTTASDTTSISSGRLWTGRILSGLSILFLAFDAVGKFVKPPPVTEAFARLQLPESTAFGIGALLLVCTLLYAIPRTAVFGAILLTGYLGGAVAIHVRAGDPAFPVIFPVIFGALVWLGLGLRNDKLRALLLE